MSSSNNSEAVVFTGIQDDETKIEDSATADEENSATAVGDILDDLVDGIACATEEITETISIVENAKISDQSEAIEATLEGLGENDVDTIKESSAPVEVSHDSVSFESGASTTIIEESTSTIAELKFKYPLGQVVNCGAFGEGSVIEQRTVDISSSPSLIYVVQLDNWKLATGKSPSFFTTESYIAESESIKLQKMIQAAKIKEAEEKAERDRLFAEWMDKTLALKKAAGDHFKNGDNLLAKDNYLGALNALNDLQQLRTELNIDERVKVVEQTVLCHNNLAVCFLKMDSFSDSISSANNAMVLIAAVEGTKQKGEFWKKMVENGVSEEKLLRDWKKKSLYCLGKAELARKNYTQAVEHLEAALKILSNYNDDGSAANMKDFRSLIAKAKHLKAEEVKKEKSTWATAFRKNETEPEVTSESAPSSPQRDSKAATPLTPPPSVKKPK
eukprot:gene35038-47081_t